MRNNRRVVITGLGVVSSLGIGWPEFWASLLAGKSGISRITAFDTSKYDRHYAGEVKNFDPAKFINKSKVKNLGRASQMAIAASKLALRDAHVKLTSNVLKNTAVCIGTTLGELRELESFHNIPKKKRKNSIDNFIRTFPSNSLTINVAAELKLHGYNLVFATACAAGNYAIGRAYDLIQNGCIESAMAGGADSFSRVVFTGFVRLHSVAKEKCQPFDKNRKGMIPGEGAGVVFLESLDSAKKRGVPIYAEILGYGLSCDAYDMTDPSVKGITKAVYKSLEVSKTNINEIDYISAHGTGTKENDRSECLAVNKIFGKRVKKVPMSSIKSMLGHTMGAASAFETIACCLAIKYGQIPPTINFKEKDPECAIDCVPNKSVQKQVKVVLNNSQAFGGNNSCMVLKRI